MLLEATPCDNLEPHGILRFSIEKQCKRGATYVRQIWKSWCAAKIMCFVILLECGWNVVCGDKKDADSKIVHMVDM